MLHFMFWNLIMVSFSKAFHKDTVDFSNRLGSQIMFMSLVQTLARQFLRFASTYFSKTNAILLHPTYLFNYINLFNTLHTHRMYVSHTHTHTQVMNQALTLLELRMWVCSVCSFWKARFAWKASIARAYVIQRHHFNPCMYVKFCLFHTCIHTNCCKILVLKIQLNVEKLVNIATWHPLSVVQPQPYVWENSNVDLMLHGKKTILQSCVHMYVRAKLPHTLKRAGF